MCFNSPLVVPRLAWVRVGKEVGSCPGLELTEQGISLMTIMMKHIGVTNRMQAMSSLTKMHIFCLISKSLSFLGAIPSKMRDVRIFQISLQALDSSRFSSFWLSWAE